MINVCALCKVSTSTRNLAISPCTPVSTALAFLSLSSFPSPPLFPAFSPRGFVSFLVTSVFVSGTSHVLHIHSRRLEVGVGSFRTELSELKREIGPWGRRGKEEKDRKANALLTGAQEEMASLRAEVETLHRAQTLIKARLDVENYQKEQEQDRALAERERERRKRRRL